MVPLTWIALFGLGALFYIISALRWLGQGMLAVCALWLLYQGITTP